MKALERNKGPMWYALYLGEEDILDGQGNPTGERRSLYSEPVRLYGNLDAGFNGRYGINSQSAVEDFGIDLRYDKTLVITDMDCPMDEYSVLIIDRPVEYNSAGQLLYDHIVVKVDKSINVLSYALKKVNVS